MMKPSFWVSLCALACCIVSLLLPAARLTIFGSGIISGWGAAKCAFFRESTRWLIWIWNLDVEHLWEGLGFIVPGFMSILNTVFVVVPVVLVRGVPTRKTRLISISVALAGLLLALVAPCVFYLSSRTWPVMLAGYFVWLAGYALLLAALALAAQAETQAGTLAGKKSVSS